MHGFTAGWVRTKYIKAVTCDLDWGYRDPGWPTLEALDIHPPPAAGIECPDPRVSKNGEVFVTDDGAETDLDLGRYERFKGSAPGAGRELLRHRRSDGARLAGACWRASIGGPGGCLICILAFEMCCSRVALARD